MPDYGTIFDLGSHWDEPREDINSRTFEHPFPDDPSHVIERRVYRQNIEKYEPLDPGELLEESDNMFLIAQDLLQRDGDLIRFYREYANLPNRPRIPETHSYEFIGFAAPNGRPRRTRAVNAEIQYDYFIPGVNGIKDLDSVPVIEGQKYYSSIGAPYETDFLTQGLTLGDTIPTRNAYLALVTAKTEIVVEDSTRTHYRGGPIIERKTIYIKAQ
jgi:hypothetical protein